MDAHQGLEKVHVRQLPGVGAELPDHQGLLKSRPDCVFVIRLHPDQHKVHVPQGKGFSRGLDDRTVHSVAVGQNLVRNQETRREQRGAKDQRSNHNLSTHDIHSLVS